MGLPGHGPEAAHLPKYDTYWEAAPKTESDQPVTLEITLPKLEAVKPKRIEISA